MSTKAADALFNEVLPPRLTTFTQKLHWKMKNDRREILTITADKYQVHDYLTERRFGHILKKRYFETTDPNTIPFEQLPRRYVVKATHTSGDNIIVKDGVDLTTREPIDRDKIVSRCKGFLNVRHWNEKNEWAYSGIEARIIVEEYIGSDDGQVPADYKFFCFDGIPRIVEVSQDRFIEGGNRLESHLDMNWKQYQVDWIEESGVPPPKGRPTRPDNFSDLIEIASRLSIPFDFARVDLYNVDGRIYFGEFTHYPSGGLARIEPASFDELLGSYWTLPNFKEALPHRLLHRVAKVFSRAPRPSQTDRSAP